MKVSKPEIIKYLWSFKYFLLLIIFLFNTELSEIMMDHNKASDKREMFADTTE